MAIRTAVSITADVDATTALWPIFYQGFYLRNKDRQIDFDDTPQNIQINRIIPMNQAIAHAYNLLPHDFRVVILKFLWNPVRGLSNYLHQLFSGLTPILCCHPNPHVNSLQLAQ